MTNEEEILRLKKDVEALKVFTQVLQMQAHDAGQQIGDIHAVNMSFGEIIKALAELPQNDAKKKNDEYQKLFRKNRRKTLPAYDETRPPGGPIPKDD